MAITVNQPVSNKPAKSLLPAMNFRMGFDGSKQLDPIQKVERDMTSFNPDIDHNGGSLYNSEEFSIVHKFESEGDKQRRVNEEDGYGEITNAQFMIIQDYYFFETYNEDTSDWLSEQLYEEEIYDRYNTYSDDYIEMVESGEIVDDGMSCRMGSPSMGESIAEEDLEGNFEDNLDPEIEEQALTTDETDPEVAELSAEDPIEPAITSDVKLSSQFAKATSSKPPEEPAAETPEPAEIEPVPVAANNASYQMRA